MESFLANMQAKGLSTTTTRHAYVLPSEILRSARRDDLLAKNPAEGVAPPKRARDEQLCLDADQVWSLAEAIRPRYRALVLTGAYAALRWGEIAGLHVSKLHLLERRIDIAETIVEVGGDLIAGPPKTGHRTVSIPAPIADEIGWHVAEFPPSSDGLVFPAPNGRPLRHANFYRREWKPALERARLDPGLRIHDLRHSAVAMAIAAGAHPKEIQELCGHASITTTLNVYGHLFESLQDRLAERLGEVFVASRTGQIRDGGRETALRVVKMQAKP